MGIAFAQTPEPAKEGLSTEPASVAYPLRPEAPASLPKDFIPLEVNQFRTPIKAPLDDKLKGPSVQYIGINDDFLPPNDDFEDRRPCRGCFSVRVRIINEGKEPIMVDGNNAFALVSGQEVKALAEDNLLQSSGSDLNKKQKVTLGLVAAGTLGLAEPILQDHFTTSKKSLVKSYGEIVIRRQLEEYRLAKRIILPNEDTYGSLFFPDAAKPLSRVVIPLLNYPGGESSGSLTVETAKP